MANALTGGPIGLDVLTVGGGVLTPGAQCSQQANGFTIATPKGITIGGNSIDGLGADGLTANAGEIGSIALGNSAATSGLSTRSIALGSGANVTGASLNAIAIGTLASAQGASATAIGSGAQALGVNTVALGNAATAAAAQQIAIGQIAGAGSGAGATGAIALGYAAGTNVQGAQNVGIGAGAGVFNGAGAGVTGARNVAIGSTDALVAAAGTGVSGSDNVAVGTGAGLGITNAGTVSIGRNALGAATGSVALGTGATTNVADSVALGTGSTITGAPAGLAFKTATAAPASQVEVGGRRITGVSGGSALTDAVNVGQLAGTANNLATTLGGSFDAGGTYTPPTYTTAAGTTATTVQGGLTNETVAMTQLGNAAAANVGAGATYTPGTGVLTAPAFSVANISATGAVGVPATATNTGAAVAGLSTDVTNLATGLTGGTVGLVQQAVTGAPLTVGAATNGTSVNFTGTAGTRRLSGVTAGIAATDAANVRQVTATIGAATANDVQYDAPGGIRANSVTLVGGALGPVTVTNVAAGSLLPGSLDAVNGSQLGATNTNVTNLNNGTAGLVQQIGGPGFGGLTVGAATGGTNVNFASLFGTRTLSGVTAGVAATDAANVGQVTAAVGAATANSVEYDTALGLRTNNVTLAGGALGPVTVTNVAAGSLLPGSTDAVNGSQLAATNTSITANTTLITNLNNGTAGLVQQAVPGAPITVGAATDGASVNFTGTAGTRRLAGVTAGIATTDAVNVGQLTGATNSLATTLGASFSPLGVYTPPTYTTASGTTATTVQGALTNETAATTQLGNAAAANAGGGATYSPGTGALSAPTYLVANISATGTVGLPTTATSTGAAVASLGTDVTNLANGLNAGTVGLVQQAVPGAPLTVGAATDGTSVNFTGTTGTRRLTGVTAGVALTDAANVGQVNATVGAATANGVEYDVIGGVRANSVTLAGGALGPVRVTNVAAGSLLPGSTDAVNGSQLAATNTNVTTNTTLITNLNNGTAGLVQQAVPGAPITVGAATNGTAVNFSGTAGARRLTGVAAGIALTDAANVGQLAGVGSLAAGAVQYDVDGLGARLNSVTLAGGAAGPVRVTNVAPGALNALSTDAVNGTQLFATNGQVATNTSNITNLTNGTAGLVQQAGGSPGAGQLTIGALTGGTSLSVAGTSGTRTITGVTAGVAATDAVNAGQLAATNTAVAGNTTSINTLNTNVGVLQTDALLYDSGAGAFSALHGGTPQRITNLQAGLVGSTSSDAVNGAQLFGFGNTVAAALGGSSAYNPLTNQIAAGIVFRGNTYTSVQGAVSAIDGASATVPSRYFHATSVMSDSQATGSDSTAIGPSAVANADGTLAAGRNTKAITAGAVALGDGSTAMDGKAVSIGSLNTASGDGAVAIGDPNVATGDGAVALGKDNTATGVGAVALGNTNFATGVGAVAIGQTNQATGDGSIAIGTSNVVNGVGALAFGNRNQVTGDGSLAFGSDIVTGGVNTLAVGNASSATGTSASAFGNGAVASGDRSAAFGAASIASGFVSTALGQTASATGYASLAIGTGSVASMLGSTAIGAGASSTAANSVALGGASSATRGALVGYTAFGIAGAQTTIGEIAIARTIIFPDPVTGLPQPAGERQITGVGAGSANTDAVNVAQLRGVSNNLGSVFAASLGGGASYDPATGILTGPTYAINGANYPSVGAAVQAPAASNALSVQYTADAAGNPTPAIDLTRGGTIAATTISGVAPGAVTAGSTQAVNGAQLYSTNAHVAGDTAALGGGAAFNPATGTYTSPTYTVQGTAVNTVGGAVAALDGAVGRALAVTANGVRYDDASHTGLTLNAGGPATTIHNLAPGVVAGDAVNLGQLQTASTATLASAESYTDQKVAGLNFDLRRQMDATGAKSAALAGVPQSINPGSGFVGASVGGQGTEVAFAVGLSKVFDGPHLPVVKAAVSVDARGYSQSYNVGAGIHF